MVFGFWAMVLVAFLALHDGPPSTMHYLEGLTFREAAFIFVIMVVAASRPVLDFAAALLSWASRLLPVSPQAAYYVTILSIGPLLGSFITEPAAMTLSAMLLRQRYLTKLAGGTVGAFALSEAGSGSDAFALTARAVEDGDGFRLTGRKLWITNANEADAFIVLATVNPGAGYKGITAFMVDRGTPGFSVGKKEDKLGIRASSTCELVLDGVRVPKKNVVGKVGQGYKIAIETLNEGRIAIGAQMVGIAQGALGDALSYTAQRKQFGKTIGSFQGVQFQLAQMATEVEAARLMVYNAARLRDTKRPFLREAAMCKLYASEAAERITSLAVQLHGGNGYTKDYPVEKLFRDAKIGQIYEGTSNMQLQTIAKMLLA